MDFMLVFLRVLVASWLHNGGLKNKRTIKSHGHKEFMNRVIKRKNLLKVGFLVGAGRFASPGPSARTGQGTAHGPEPFAHAELSHAPKAGRKKEKTYAK
jgi:hypothetical protein